MPWFMTVFGRDTIVTCLQTLLFGPDLARSALETLAELQAREDDPSIDAEPGKIVHEVRHGKTATAWHGTYYGTADATPLYLILLSEVWRWTGDDDLAARLEREVEALQQAFDAAFWRDERGGYYVLGLDADKRQVDALTSNMGHLLWSGIVPEHRVDAVVSQLTSDSLWSGWGVRTMGASEGGYNPLSYHNGTVWPHDNSLIAWGLARYSRWEEVHRIARRMLEAAGFFSYQLPEVFAGLSRGATPFPIAYPTAARPQAWAAGTPVLLLRLLLGLRPNLERRALESVAPELPPWAGRLSLERVRAFDRAWNVQLENGRVTVSET